jgi:acetolactate synthase-1/2/3 large subunit
VVEGAGAYVANFPKNNEFYIGSKIGPLMKEMDLVILLDSWAPWYPPSNKPKNAKIISISENPLKDTMVYQTMDADQYLEGDIALTLTLLTEAVRKLGFDAAKVAERRTRWNAEHKKWRDGITAAEDKAAAKDVITIPLLMKTLREVMPKDTCYVDETIVHAGDIREHILWDEPNAYFRAPSGLGQGLGYALGVKLALPKRPVVMTIGDGSFLYNPVMPALTVADEYNLPLLIVICNNKKYAIMEQLHNRFYPEGTAIKTRDYYGVHINNSRYEEAAAVVGGYGQLVEKPAELAGAIRAALASVRAGKPAILNVMLPDAGVQR